MDAISQSDRAVRRGDENEIRPCCRTALLPIELIGVGERRSDGPGLLPGLFWLCGAPDVLAVPIRGNLRSFLVETDALCLDLRIDCSIFDHFSLLFTRRFEFSRFPSVLPRSRATGVSRFLLPRPPTLLRVERMGVKVRSEGTAGIDSAYLATWLDLLLISSSNSSVF